MRTMSMSDINDWCSKGNIPQLRRLHEQGELIQNLNNSSGVYGYKPLHAAAANNQREVIEYILSIDNPDRYIEEKACSNYTPLHIAIMFGHLPCVESLLNHNANIEAIDTYGKSLLSTANDYCKNSIILLKKEGKSG